MNGTNLDFPNFMSARLILMLYFSFHQLNTIQLCWTWETFLIFPRIIQRVHSRMRGREGPAIVQPVTFPSACHSLNSKRV